MPKSSGGERLNQLVFGVTSEFNPSEIRGHQVGTVPEHQTVNRAESPAPLDIAAGD
jgi:hypothetical protein